RTKNTRLAVRGFAGRVSSDCIPTLGQAAVSVKDAANEKAPTLLPAMSGPRCRDRVSGGMRVRLPSAVSRTISQSEESVAHKSAGCWLTAKDDTVSFLGIHPAPPPQLPPARRRHLRCA